MSKETAMSKVFAQGAEIWRTLRFDNWQNVFTGLGTARDKNQFGRFHNLTRVRETELTALYHQNDTAKRIVALKPQEMMRKGFAVNIEDDTDASSAVGESLVDLEAGMKVRDAMIWGRLYGGGVVVIGADDGRPAEEPLDENNIKSLKFLHVIDKRHLIPESFFEDPLNDEFFGEPQTYRITPRRGATNLVVHRSRLLIFGGAHTSDEERDRLGQWDHSVIEAIYPVLRSFDNVWQAAEHLMSDSAQAVFKIQGLMSMIAGGQKDLLQTRMQLVDMSRSVARALLLDADAGEEFTREATSFTDAQNMLDKFMLRLASAAETPVTILMGQSPAGMNATGESDFRWFYDTISTGQQNDLKPKLKYLVRILMLSKEGPTKGNLPEAWSIKFAPLWELTPSEQAALEKTTAEKDVMYINADVVLPEEVAVSRFRPEGFSVETQIDRDLREKFLASEKELPETEPEETEPDEKTETDPEEGSGKLILASTDLAIITRVNEGREANNLPALTEEEGGKMFIAQFKAQQEAEGAKVGEAEGDVAAEEIDPGGAPSPAPGTPPPFGGAPPAPPSTPETEEE